MGSEREVALPDFRAMNHAVSRRRSSSWFVQPWDAIIEVVKYA
jgi:hypothetical protein